MKSIVGAKYSKDDGEVEHQVPALRVQLDHDGLTGHFVLLQLSSQTSVDFKYLLQREPGIALKKYYFLYGY